MAKDTSDDWAVTKKRILKFIILPVGVLGVYGFAILMIVIGKTIGAMLAK